MGVIKHEVDYKWQKMCLESRLRHPETYAETENVEETIKKIQQQIKEYERNYKMNELKLFENEEFGKIRTTTINNEPYFVGKDVAEALGYTNTKDAIISHVDEEDKQILQRSQIATLENHLPKTVFPVNFVSADIPNRGLTVINESGLYSLVIGSKLPTAKKFKHWVTSEVLPTIRKTGGYVNNDELFINTYMPHADEQTKAMFRSTLENVRSLNAKIERDKPKVLFADAVETSKTSILVGDLAKLLKQNGFDIGQKRLFERLRNEGYLIRTGSSRNMPTQKAMERGLFEIKERTINNPDGSVNISCTTVVTGKGQVYFANKYLRRDFNYV